MESRFWLSWRSGYQAPAPAGQVKRLAEPEIVLIFYFGIGDDLLNLFLPYVNGFFFQI